MLHQLEEIARDAGEILLRHYGDLGAAEAERKGGRRRDLVSRADLESEARILEAIPPGDDVLAEERGSRDRGARRRWIVDPLDGTVNFLHRIPLWCVSLAVLEGPDLVAAVVHAPALGHTFSAAAGAGCRVDGEPARVSPVSEIGDAILATGFPYGRDELQDNNLENVPRLGLLAGGLRRLGSAALDLALVSCGRLDGFWELHLEPWDVAAGILLVREAGGRVTDFRGGEEVGDLLHGRNLVASNGRIHERVRGELAPLREL